MNNANFSSRLMAFILDVLILGLPCLIFLGIFLFPFLVSDEVMESLKADDFSGQNNIESFYRSGIKVQIAMIMLWGVVTAIFVTSKKQGTPGKMIMKLKIITGNGGKVSFFNAFARIVSLPLVILLVQTPERYLIYENLEKARDVVLNLSDEEFIAQYLQTSLTSITNIITLILISVWFLNMSRDKNKRTFHDVLFDTRVVYDRK